MKVILLKAVPKIGKPDDIVEVSEGFARNALFPQKLAVPMTAATLAQLHRKQSARETTLAMRHALLEKAMADLSGTTLVCTVPANEQGNLFSKIDAKDLAKLLLAHYRIDIDPACIVLPRDYIKHLGVYTVRLKEKNFNGAFTVEIARNELLHHGAGKR